MINQNCTYSVEEFIERALYDKKLGYYSQRNPFGNDGDFVTAPLISPLFSEMISIWIISYWVKLGKPKNFSIVELGPGNGAFCKTLCRVLKNFPELKKSTNIYLVEKSERLAKIQKNLIKDKNVFWIKKLSHIKKGPVLFFGNEFFDSIPIKQFKVKKFEIYEKYLNFENGKFKKFIFKKTSKKDIKKLSDLKLLIRKGIIEYPQKGLKILDIIIKKVQKLKGGILLIDYGYVKAQNNDTLQSLKSKKKKYLL